MKKFNKRIPLLFASFALMMGIGLASGAKVVKADPTTVTVSMGTYADEHNIPKSSGTLNEESIVPELYLDENITVTAEMTDGHATNEASFWASGNEWRLYNGGQDTSSKLVISAKNNATLVSYSITYTSNNDGTLATSRGQSKDGEDVISSNAVVAASGTTAECYVANTGTKTNGQVKVTKITVVYAMPEENPDIPVDPVDPVEVATVTLELTNKYNDHYGRFTYSIDRPDVTLEGKTAKDTKINGVQPLMFEYLNDHEFNAYITDSNYQEDEYVFEWFENGELVAQGTYINEVILPNEPVKLKAPEGLVIHANTNALAFASVPNATGYHVQYRQGGEVKYEHDITNGGILNPDNNYAAGTYEIWIKSLGDGEYYLDSDYVTAGSLVITKDAQAIAAEFLADWYALRDAEDSICTANPNDVKDLIARYDALDADVKAIVDVAEDGANNTVKNSVEYMRAYLNTTAEATEEQSTTGLLLSVAKENKATIAIVVTLIAVSFAGFVVLNKKRKLVK